MDFILDLQRGFSQNKSAENAVAMEAYMKNHFPFLGIKAALRRSILKAAHAANKQEVTYHARDISLKLFELPEREYHHTAIDILIKQLDKKFIPEDIELIEHLLTTKSWWDSVDAMAKYLLGGYLKHYPEETEGVIARFSTSGNMWLNRSAIIFQLDYKKQTDALLLFSLCEKHSASKEFFIQKAIGWALREYAKSNPEAVKTFVINANLKPLSKREALKNL
ncbi:DNA alkylation repair protein [Flavobacterium sp. RHBU_24]|uniref:DNA alkylation repair protein n=1 Tax=Flavobacterium sp. RHBU_24 TaxID=3391185 RepID=UPI003984EF4C